MQIIGQITVLRQSFKIFLKHNELFTQNMNCGKGIELSWSSNEPYFLHNLQSSMQPVLLLLR